ncbi:MULTISPECIES: isochorismatase [Cupriavidus]
MQPDTSPYTVSVYPIQQQPGVWFATYMISEYRGGAEHVVANVTMRHATHGTEAQAKQAARTAAERAAAGMRLQRTPRRARPAHGAAPARHPIQSMHY